EALQEGQVATSERTLRLAAPDGGDPIFARDQHVGRTWHLLQAAGGLGAGQYPLEVSSTERRHRIPCDGSVERDDARLPGDPGEQGRDVRKADDGLRAACQRLEIHALDDSSNAEATP